MKSYPIKTCGECPASYPSPVKGENCKRCEKRPGIRVYPLDPPPVECPLDDYEQEG